MDSAGCDELNLRERAVFRRRPPCPELRGREHLLSDETEFQSLPDFGRSGHAGQVRETEPVTLLRYRFIQVGGDGEGCTGIRSLDRHFDQLNAGPQAFSHSSTVVAVLSPRKIPITGCCNRCSSKNAFVSMFSCSAGLPPVTSRSLSYAVSPDTIDSVIVFATCRSFERRWVSSMCW